MAGKYMNHPLVKAARKYLSDRSMVQATTDRARKHRAQKQKEARAKKVTKMRTPKKKAVKGGAQYSKSRGFFKPGRRGRTPFDRVGKYGVTVCRENGLVTTGTSACTYVGHSTMERFVATQDVGYALAKWISLLFKKDLALFSSVAWITGETDPQMQFTVRKQPDLATVQVAISITPGTTTWEDIAIQIRSNVIDASARAGVEFCIIAFSAVIGGQIRTFNMLRAKINVYIKSALKLQNRTVNVSTNDENDDVDNVPLYGKSYEGTGNYMKIANGVNALSDFTFAPNAAYGTCPVIVHEFGPNDPLSEPPKTSQLYNVKKSGKAHLDPGEVKTSVLTYNKRFGLNKFLSYISKGNIVAGSDSTINIGNYRIFALEKMINSIATSATTGIKVAYEHDHKTAMSIYCKPTIVSNTIVATLPSV